MKKVVVLSAAALVSLGLVGCGKQSNATKTGSATSSAVVDQYTKGEWALMAYMKTGDVSAHDLKKNVDQLTLKHKGNRYTLKNDVQSFVCEIKGNQVKVTLQDADGQDLSDVSYTKKELAKQYQGDLATIDRVLGKLQDHRAASSSSSADEPSASVASSSTPTSASSSAASSSSHANTSNAATGTQASNANPVRNTGGGNNYQAPTNPAPAPTQAPSYSGGSAGGTGAPGISTE